MDNSAEATLMGRTNPRGVHHLRAAQIETLKAMVCDAADRMTDGQILALADCLHDTLRARRALRHHSNERLGARLCGQVTDVRI
jgi:hypothetical protein